MNILSGNFPATRISFGGDTEEMRPKVRFIRLEVFFKKSFSKEKVVNRTAGKREFPLAMTDRI